MSDPVRNRWFRRRWHEPSPVSRWQPPGAIALACALELTGHELREMWRCEVARGIDRSAEPLQATSRRGNSR